MSEEVKDKMLEVAKILFKNNVPIEQAKFIGDFIETQNNKLQQKENIIKEVREYIEKYSIMYEHEVEPYKVVESEELLKILDKEVN